MALIIYKGVMPDEHGKHCVSRLISRTNPSRSVLKTAENWCSINMSVRTCHIKAPPLSDGPFSC